MRTDTDTFSMDYTQRARAKKKRIATIFLGAILLSVLLVSNITFLKRPTSHILSTIQGSFSPLVLWSLVLQAYAFRLLSNLSMPL